MADLVQAFNLVLWLLLIVLVISGGICDSEQDYDRAQRLYTKACLLLIFLTRAR